MPQDYAKLAAQHGGAPAAPAKTDYAALAKETGGSAKPAEATAAKPEERSWYAPLADFVSQLQSLNPSAINDAVQQTFWHPVDTVKGMARANGDLWKKAQSSFESGDYQEGVRHLGNYLFNAVPGLGTRLDQAGDDINNGEIVKGIGKTFDASIATMGPAAVSRIRNVSVPGLGGSRLNPQEAAAVSFGESRGVPLDAATATGRPIVSIVQKRASDTMGGAGVAEGVKANQATALARVGGELADQAAPAAVDAVGAGQGVRDAVTGRITQLHKEATTAYDSLRALEQKQAGIIQQHGGIQAPQGAAKPFTTVPLAVNVAPAKAALTPLYQQLMREKELVGVLQGGKARTLTALDSLLNGPDLAPLSVVDGALGDLKAMARGAEMPELRTGGQASAAEAVTHLDAQVRARAAEAGPNVLKALEDGRSATVKKYQAADVLDTLSSEPRKVFDMLTTRKDGALERLKAVQREAPAEIPNVGRAYLEELLNKATSEGGFDHADALFADWQKLGPQTKQILFKGNQGLIAELDNYFLLAKRIAANPNPSGTARVLTAMNLSSTIPTYALAKLLYSPKGVRLLRKGLTIQAGDKAATAAYTAEVSRMAQEAGQLAPAAAQNDPSGRHQ